MLRFHHFKVSEEPLLTSNDGVFFVSIITLIQSLDELRKLKSFAEINKVNKIEIVAIINLPDALYEELEYKKFMEWRSNTSISLLRTNFSVSLPNLWFDYGIRHTSGTWIWFLDFSKEVPSWGIADFEKKLNGISSIENSLIININPDENAQLITIPGVVDIPWIDLLYKGFAVPLVNIFFSRLAFEKYGLFDPHIAVSGFYATEYLLRIVRYSKFVALEDNIAARGIKKSTLPPFFFDWLDIDRSTKLLNNTIDQYSIDDTFHLSLEISEEKMWSLYLDYVLPFYIQYSHILPRGFPEFVQSHRPKIRRVYCLKRDYETTTDVGLRNFDQLTKGSNFFKLVYYNVDQFDIDSIEPNSAILFIRTADLECLKLAQTCVERGIPVGYYLDDDLLHFHEYPEFKEFNEGHPAYDAMVSTIKLADSVMCVSQHVEDVVKPLNPRTTKFEGSALPEYLPSIISYRPKGKTFKFAYAGGGYRQKEMQMLLPAIEKICQEYGDRVEFEFWGIDPARLPQVTKQMNFVPFSVNYYEYLSRLKSAGFNAMLVPLLLAPSPRRAKAPNKIYESGIAGAIGIYSDVPTYQLAKQNNIGIMAEENSNSWYLAMKSLLDMTDDTYRELLVRTLHFVWEYYSTPSMQPNHESNLEAIFFHAETRNLRSSDGRPTVAFVFPIITGTGGGEIALRRRMELAQQIGIRPLAVVPEYWRDKPELGDFMKYLVSLSIPYDYANFLVYLTTPSPSDVLPSPEEEASVRALFLRNSNISLVHTGGFIPAIGKICSELNLIHVVAHFGVDDNFQWSAGSLPYKYCDVVHSDSIRYAKKWAQLFASDWVCIRETSPESLFKIGFDRLFASEEPVQARQKVRIGMVGTVFPRKSQLEVIKAVSILKNNGISVELFLYGHSKGIPDYYEKCREFIDLNGLGDQIFFMGHVPTLEEIYINLDLVLSVSTFESFPTVIKEATASGVLLIVSRAGGITELVVDGINGLIVDNTVPDEIAAIIQKALSLKAKDDLEIRRNAYRMALREFYHRKGLKDILALYNYSFAVAQGSAPAKRTVHSFVKEQNTNTDETNSLENYSTGMSKSTIPLSRVTTYDFVCSADYWTGLDIKVISTHSDSTKAALKIQDNSGRLFRTTNTIITSGFGAESWVSFRFDPICNSKNREFQVSFFIDSIERPNAIYVQETNRVSLKLIRALRRAWNIVKLPLPKRRGLFYRAWFVKGRI